MKLKFRQSCMLKDLTHAMQSSIVWRSHPQNIFFRFRTRSYCSAQVKSSPKKFVSVRPCSAGLPLPASIKPFLSCRIRRGRKNPLFTLHGVLPASRLRPGETDDTKLQCCHIPSQQSKIVKVLSCTAYCHPCSQDSRQKSGLER